MDYKRFYHRINSMASQLRSLKFPYKIFFTAVMFLSEGFAAGLIVLMVAVKDSLNALVFCGFLALIFTVITMSLHVIVRLEELFSKIPKVEKMKEQDMLEEKEERWKVRNHV